MITKTFLIASILLIVLPISVLVFQQYGLLPSVENILPQLFFKDEKAPIEKAIQDAIQEEEEASLAYLLYETQIEGILISKDGQWATAWLTPLDPDTKQIIPTEPGLAIVQRIDTQWQVVLPSENEWIKLLQETPDDLISPTMKSNWTQIAEPRASALNAGPYGGYYLPWQAGETMALTQSVGHDRYTPSGSAHFAFDFAKVGYPSGMFDVHAAGFGTVKQAVWRHPNGDPTYGNYIVLEDTSTISTTYQLYLHLAQDSIPNKFRQIGAFVSQGDFIGVADDTGVSSGNHLHFHVHTYPYSYWGTSVDITFEDVSINGGRPRIETDLSYCKSTDVCDSTQRTYISQNTGSSDHTPPYGGFDNPKLGELVSTSTLHLTGWALDDDSGLASAQITAKYNGSWHPLGDPFNTSPFNYSWDFCSDQVPDGPISLALELKDHAYNQAEGLPGLIHFIKNIQCPVEPSICQPSNDQIALLASKDYQGDCVVLNIGEYGQPALLGDLSDDQATSIQVGDNVQATLFANEGFSVRGETFTTDDSNLKDNRIGKNNTSSVIVEARGSQPENPSLVWPGDSATFTSDSSFSLSWEDKGGGLQFKARLLQNETEILASDWQKGTFWHINSLDTGNYTWQVKARNGDLESAWSISHSFVIEDTSQASPSTASTPFTDSMENGENGWTHSNNWTQVNDVNHTPDGAISWHYHVDGESSYNNGDPNAGYLTSPEIEIPASGETFLRFWYQYESEDDELNWDQRWVQIAADGEQFTNTLQLSDDASSYWLQSPAISLASYAGKNIRVRYYFATLDNLYNDFQGWYIDDFSITADPDPDCSDTNNTHLQATEIMYGDSIEAVICPPGDLDFYRFQGTQGDRIAAWTEAESAGSPLDSYLFLLDHNGKSLLNKNDDLVTAEQKDSSLAYDLPRTGVYYLKVRSWDHTTSGGMEYTYKLNLAKDHNNPSSEFIHPKNREPLIPGIIELIISAADSTTGISHVLFFWHNSDWKDTDWVKIGEDWHADNGWKTSFEIPEGSILTGSAFYAIAYDWAGNYIGTGAWNLGSASTYLPLIKK